MLTWRAWQLAFEACMLAARRTIGALEPGQCEVRRCMGAMVGAREGKAQRSTPRCHPKVCAHSTEERGAHALRRTRTHIAFLRHRMAM